MAAHRRRCDPEFIDELFDPHLSVKYNELEDAFPCALHSISLRSPAGFFYFIVIKAVDAARACRLQCAMGRGTHRRGIRRRCIRDCLRRGLIPERR